ncbi:MAG: thioredoxin domain-containing protein [Novosphingobium sp.]
MEPEPMNLKRTAILALAALFSLAASPPKSAPARGDWNATIVTTADGTHIIGNPQAALKLTEYVSYTCPHCAHFDVEGEGAMRLAWVAPGKLRIEVRHIMRDPVDATVAQLTNCGPAGKFFMNHAAFMRSQTKWLSSMNTASDAQRARWVNGDLPSRRRAIATDFHLYQVMEQRGYSRPMLDRCLADETLAKRLALQTADAERMGINSTPSFAINDVVLAGTHDWRMLEPQLRARM